MLEQNPPDFGNSPKGTAKSFTYFTLAALLAAGLCLALISLGPKFRPAANSAETGGAATRAPAAQSASAAPPMRPLGRSLEGITTRYKKMQPGWTEPIISGPLHGGSVWKYSTGSATDDLSIKNGAVYRRTMSFRLAEMVKQVDGTHATFSGLVFIYALYPSAFDKEYDSGQIPPELKTLGDAFGEKCGALVEPGSRPGEYRQLHDGYVFSCSNKDVTRLIYGVCSEGLLASEAAGIR